MSGKKQLFPINTKPACLLKWGWSNIFFQSGTTSSCHRTQKHMIPVDDFGSFHNVPKKIDDRNRMLQGEWPSDDCNYCKKVEDTGGYSDRMHQLSQQTDINLNPPELANNASAVHVTPTMLEVYFKNTCNMSCVYCGPHFSSKWQEENKKHTKIPELDATGLGDVNETQHNPHYDKQKQDFWKYLKEDERYKKLRWFSLLGGEPLLIPELDECLDFWNDHPNDALTFQLITNLKCEEKRFDQFLEKINNLIENKKIYNVKVIASIDCLTTETEYVRYGMSLEKWHSNFAKLLASEKITVGINSAVTILTLPYFDSLLKQINVWNSTRSSNRIIHSFNTDSKSFDPTIAGHDFFHKQLEYCTELMPSKNLREISTKKYWRGIVDSFSGKQKNKEKIENLKVILSKLDERRNTNWKKVFPWLIEL